MSLTTVTVSIASFQAIGSVLPNGTVTFELTSLDVDGALIAPAPATVTLDANGAGSVTLWPNSRGTQGTQYRVGFFDSDGVMQWNGVATVPTSNCYLHDILSLAPPVSVDDATAAKLAAQAAAALAQNWATKTDTEVVAGQGYGAKKYAQDAQAQADVATGAANTAIANVNTLAGIATQIGTVADIAADVSAVAADHTSIVAVAGDLPNINAASGYASAAVTSETNAATSAAAAATSATAAGTAKTAAEAARDASFALGPKYVDEPTGRAAVADGATFLVQGTTNVAAFEYRRVNSTSSTLIATYPSKAFIDSITALLQSGGLQIYTGAGPIYPLATDANLNVVLWWDATNNTIGGTGMVTATSLIPTVQTDLLAPAGQASFTASGPVIPIRTDTYGKVLLGYDTVNGVIVGPGILSRAEMQAVVSGTAPSTLSALTLTPVAKAVNGMVFYGESTSVGAQGTPIDSTTQPYSNITFHGGPRAWTGAAWDFTAFKGLVEDAVSPAPDGSTGRGETCCSGAANYAITLAAKENGIVPSSHVIFSSTAGHGGYKISQLAKGQTWYSTLTSHVSGAKALNSDFAVHVVGLILGINDAAASTAYATYRAGVEQLQVDVETDIKAITGQTSPVYMLMNQISYAAATWPDEAKAQLDLAQKNSKFVLVTPSYHLPVAGDGVHLTADGYKWLGAYFGRAYKQMVIDGKRPKWLNPLSATIRGAVIRVRLDVPYAPLVLDTTQLAPATNYGFKVLDGASPVTINSVAIDGSDVVITLSATPAGAVTVRYGLDYLGTGLTITNGASGNLRDSDPSTITISSVARPLFNVCPHFQLSATVLGE